MRGDRGVNALARRLGAGDRSMPVATVAIGDEGLFTATREILGDTIGRAMHAASQVGGPWTPCLVPYAQWPECEHEPMGLHVAGIILGHDELDPA